jgi:PAS domain S-box-containing protein
MGQNELRTRAEKSLRMTRRDIGALSNEGIQQLVHELQVHQIELEMQNEALRTAQHEAEQSRVQYRELFDSAPVGYCVLDARGTIVRINSAGRALLGGASLARRAAALRTFVAAGDRPKFDEQLKAAPLRSQSSCEVRLWTQSGTPSDVRLDVSVMDGQPSDRLVVMTDVSERKRSLEALERLNQELEARVAARTAQLEEQNQRLAAELECRANLEAQQSQLEARMRAGERLESLGLMAAGIAHDFNNLLVSVLGNAEILLRRSDLCEAITEPVTMIKRAGGQAAELTRQLLLFAGRGQLNTSPVHLPKLVAENVALLRVRVPGAIRLEAFSTDDLPPIEADRGQVSQVVLNLVTNAIEALGEAEGTVIVDARLATLDEKALSTFQIHQNVSPGEFVLLRVQDTGPGMDAGVQQRIFDPFFSTKFTGRGLGLAMVSGIVQSHHGAVRVVSSVGAGTSIDVAFRPAESRKASDRPPPSVTDWKGSGPVLLIDDDESVRTVMANLLELLGFEVTAASSGEAGLQLYRHGAGGFKLIVLDWIMPGMSGAAVLAQLRKFEPELPVILISGYSVEDLATYDPHAICLQKPMTFEVLRDALRSMVADTPTA